MKDKKALLMTWYNTPNYGTLLQCYATIKLFENRYGIDLYIAKYRPKGKRDLDSIIKKIFLLNTWRRRYKIICNKLMCRNFSDKFHLRDEMIKSFILDYKYASNGKEIKTNADFKELNSEFNIFISGSDQIWNPDFLNEHFLLDFVQEGKQCISVASSVSKGLIDEDKIEIYKKYLKKYSGITVREEECVQQLNTLLSKDVYAILDPTLLLGTHAWKSCMVENNEQDYMLVYILGKSSIVRENSIKLSKRICDKIYYFPHIDGNFTKADVLFENDAAPLWDESPFEWIGWINNAKLIITDSFHMTVFSIMLHKNFYVVPKELDNPSQNKRILNILKLVGLEERMIGYNNILELTCSDKEIEWGKVDYLLENRRKKDLNILDLIIEGLE